jgi:hypothetical protein
MTTTTTRPNIADTMREPANGSKIVCVDADGTPTVIWRDDHGYGLRSDHADERWYEDRNSDPMAWREILRYATAVHAVSVEPVARTKPATENTPMCGNEDHYPAAKAVARLSWPDGPYHPTTACAECLSDVFKQSCDDNTPVAVEPIIREATV